MLTRIRSARSAKSTDGRQETISSRLLPMILERLDDEDRIVVLDSGSGSQSTLDFFSGLPTQLHFVDLFAAEVVTNPPEELTEAGAADAFTAHLDLPADIVFDVCLFWDVLQHLEPVQIRGLSRALAPHLSGQTLGYGFGTLHGQDPGNFRYGIQDRSHLTARPISRTTGYRGYSQQQLDENFSCLGSQRATLLQEGRLELLLARN